MARIGLVDLDTTHPSAFVPILRGLGHEVVAVCDEGTVHPPGHPEAFAARHRVDHVCASPEEMAGLVDVAFVLGCDWDRHVVRARPFAERGIPLFIDKPVAGSAAHLREIQGWRDAGLRVTGGSSLYTCREARDRRRERPRSPRFAVAGCSGHPLDYGVHAYSLLLALFGTDVAAVRDLGGPPSRAEVRWRSGHSAVAVVSEAAGHPYWATIVGAEVDHLTVHPDPARLYRDFVRYSLDLLLGERADADPPDAFLLAERCAVAAGHSAALGGIPVSPGLEGVGTSGTAVFPSDDFVAAYRLRRRVF
ncbi:hypothetical protein GCM10017673_50340 [Streptosporangium violaceochromogenes]|nr:hypothetical protein GCM10017673_50340 [Streptosporangium violaceochromogenes]